MKVINANWFNNTVGFVLCQDEITGKYKCYIGTGQGYDEWQDTQNIMDYGSKITKDMAESVFGDLPNYGE